QWRVTRALYVHWPFCLRKCPYCDFNSHVRERVEVDEWSNALLRDLFHEAEESRKALDFDNKNEARVLKSLNSVFFGGGTPSLMPPGLVGAILNEAERQW